MDSHFLTSTLLTSILISCFPIGVSASQTELEGEFRAAYEKFRQAVIAKNPEQMKVALSTSAYMTMKNQGVAYKKEFPKDFFEGMGGKLHSATDLSKLRNLQAIEKNGTGILIAFAPKTARFDPFEMGGNPQAFLLIFTFVKENKWKFHTSSMQGLDDKVETNILNGDLSILNADKYQPSGVTPAIPDEVAAPDYDYDAILNIVFGEDVEVTLNGKAFPKANGSHSSRTGVKKGENTIVIKGGSSSIKISIYAKKNDDTDPVKVFDIDLEKPEPVITKIFRVAF